MRRWFAVLAMMATLVVGFAKPVPAQNASNLVIPDSSIARDEDAGKRVHTNVRGFMVGRSLAGPLATPGPPFPGLLYHTPASIACIYRLQRPRVGGCNPNVVTVNPAGGAGAIAIVDAYDDPTAASDLAMFSAQFGLPGVDSSNFQVVYADGTQPAQDPTGGWELEESLDIEWAHAMAPGAFLYLVEAASNSYADLNAAVLVASNLVMSAGGGQVSMSWGSSEFPAERSFDAFFTTPSVVYFASSGDSAGAHYPSASPNVVSVGGTTLSMNPFTGDFEKESAWGRTGGGPSRYEPIPSYQQSLSLMSDFRVTPDVALVADPVTGVWVADSNPVNGAGGPGAWWIVGGTSVSAPTVAGIVNAAGTFASSTTDELTELYSDVESVNFHDVTAGVCGPYGGFLAGRGYDFCTGLGSVKGYQGK